MVGAVCSSSALLDGASQYPPIAHRLHPSPDWCGRYDLILAAGVGFTGPKLNSATIGGGICFGEYEKCSAMVSGSSDAELIALGTRNQSNYHERHEHLTMLQERARQNDVIAAELYAGFDAAIGMAFFYAAITAVTMGDIATAFVGSDNFPSWMREVGIEAYDQAACDEAGGSELLPIVIYSSRSVCCRSGRCLLCLHVICHARCHNRRAGASHGSTRRVRNGVP